MFDPFVPQAYNVDIGNEREGADEQPRVPFIAPPLPYEPPVVGPFKPDAVLYPNEPLVVTETPVFDPPAPAPIEQDAEFYPVMPFDVAPLSYDPPVVVPIEADAELYERVPFVLTKTPPYVPPVVVPIETDATFDQGPPYGVWINS